jgi:methyltransferase (TIGR00027 family)
MTSEGFPSGTARRVAAHRLGFDRPSTPYGDPAADNRLAADVAGPAPVDLSGSMNRYLRARTAFFDRVVIDWLDRGMAQVVCIGAGYDGRSLRYAKPGVTWWEVDHPATQADKVTRLDKLGIDAPHIAFVGLDLRWDALGSALVSRGVDPGSPSLFLCEGVAVYLEAAVLETLLRELRTLAMASSRLAISAATTASSEGHAARRGRFQRAVATMGEPVRNSLTGGQMTQLLSDTGWQVQPASDRALPVGLLLAGPA